jgi:hypothetical protein
VPAVSTAAARSDPTDECVCRVELLLPGASSHGGASPALRGPEYDADAGDGDAYGCDDVIHLEGVGGAGSTLGRTGSIRWSRRPCVGIDSGLAAPGKACETAPSRALRSERCGSCPNRDAPPWCAAECSQAPGYEVREPAPPSRFIKSWLPIGGTDWRRCASTPPSYADA